MLTFHIKALQIEREMTFLQKFLVVPTFSFSVYLLGYFKSCLNKSCQDGDQSVSYNLELQYDHLELILSKLL